MLATMGNRADLPVMAILSVPSVGGMIAWGIFVLVHLEIFEDAEQEYVDSGDTDFVEEIVLQKKFQYMVFSVVVLASTAAVVRLTVALFRRGDCASHDVQMREHRAAYVRERLNIPEPLLLENVAKDPLARAAGTLSSLPLKVDGGSNFSPGNIQSSASLMSAASTSTTGSSRSGRSRRLGRGRRSKQQSGAMNGGGFLLDPGWAIEVKESSEGGTIVHFVSRVGREQATTMASLPLRSVEEQQKCESNLKAATARSKSEVAAERDADDNGVPAGIHPKISYFSEKMYRVIQRCPTMVVISAMLAAIVVVYFYMYFGSDRYTPPLTGLIDKVGHFQSKVDKASHYANVAEENYNKIDGSLEQGLDALEECWADDPRVGPGCHDGLTYVIDQLNANGQYNYTYAGIIDALESALNVTSAIEAGASEAFADLYDLKKDTDVVHESMTKFSNDWNHVWKYSSPMGMLVAFISLVEGCRNFKRRDNSLRRGRVRASGEWRTWETNRFSVKRVCKFMGYQLSTVLLGFVVSSTVFTAIGMSFYNDDMRKRLWNEIFYDHLWNFWIPTLVGVCLEHLVIYPAFV